MIPSEHIEQRELVNWTKKKSLNDPRYDLLFAIPNGGQRHIAVASKLKLEGVKPGVPDLFLAYPVFPKHGLFIEMKRQKGGRLTLNQENWFKKLKDQGYACEQANGYEEAKIIMKAYLAGK